MTTEEIKTTSLSLAISALGPTRAFNHKDVVVMAGEFFAFINGTVYTGKNAVEDKSVRAECQAKKATEDHVYLYQVNRCGPWRTLGACGDTMLLSKAEANRLAANYVAHGGNASVIQVPV